MGQLPTVQLIEMAPFWSRMMHFHSAGDFEPGHTHDFDHFTFLVAGELDVTVNGETTTFVAPKPIFIKAGLVHKLTARKDNTVAACLHVLRQKYGDGAILDPSMVPAGVPAVTVAANV